MMTEILIFLVGVFAFISLALILELREARGKLLNMTEGLYEAQADIEYWEKSWEHLWQQYKKLTIIDEGSDSSPYVMGDTSFDDWKVEGADSTPQPDSWKVLTL